MIPKKEIQTVADLTKWEKSQAYRDYLHFIMLVNDKIKGKSMKGDIHLSVAVTSLLNLLDTIDDWIAEIPPLEQPQRFGNKAYREWHKKLQEEADSLIKKLIPANCTVDPNEFPPYLLDSFGNSTRIDYGTGHEAAFIMFLVCLYNAKIICDDDAIAVGLKVFHRYLKLCRNLQLTYRMEPAGSQGVWSLDDFQFVPFIWGSAQLINSQAIAPEMFVQESVIQKYSDDFMFIDCIKFINQVKTGPFAEHSNKLWNITAVPSWSKVNLGLVKMYKAEV